MLDMLLDAVKTISAVTTPERVKARKEKDKLYKVGDKVTIRTVEDMLKEYGPSPLHEHQPNVLYGFPFNPELKDGMIQCCGKSYEIVDIITKDYTEGIAYEFMLKGLSYSFSSDMFELPNSDKIEKATEITKRKAKKCKFKIGDKVRIRDWDDMAKEFGVNTMGGTINVPFSFTKTMREELTGKVFTIKDILNDYYNRYEDDKYIETPVYKIKFNEDCFWNISEQMCELVKPEKKATKLKDEFTDEERETIIIALNMLLSKLN